MVLRGGYTWKEGETMVAGNSKRLHTPAVSFNRKTGRKKKIHIIKHYAAVRRNEGNLYTLI